MNIFRPSCIAVLAALSLGCTPRAASRPEMILFPAAAGHEHVRPGELAPTQRLAAPAAPPCDSVTPMTGVDSTEWRRVPAPTPLPAGVSAATIRLPDAYRLEALQSPLGRSPDELAHWVLPATDDSALWLRSGNDSIRTPVMRRSIFATINARPGYPQTAGHAPARETWSRECQFQLAGRPAFAYFLASPMRSAR